VKEYSFANQFMQLALQEAQKAFDEGEVPVGCVIVDSTNNSIIATTRNQMQKNKNPNFHAEILAINLACSKLDNKNLSKCDIYITLEPCTMCSAAIANTRIRRLYYSAGDRKQGGVENGLRFFNSSSCFHRPEIYSGMLEYESANIMQSFFSKMRKNKL
jgi:tRNA(adenine34) deaminase